MSGPDERRDRRRGGGPVGRRAQGLVGLDGDDLPHGLGVVREVAALARPDLQDAAVQPGQQAAPVLRAAAAVRPLGDPEIGPREAGVLEGFLARHRTLLVRRRRGPFRP
ncbi:hypothetical protein [Streptomyces sp. 8K308]|uniref:hypothetical protein n=1 Tax=Streptomyces sp. 8K308 TaxID=2530388 RepID=UPI001FB5D308|nr:hypothetical protein [Streptomyces sp. 8K308]